MYKLRYFKKLSIWILVFLQIFLLSTYFYFQSESFDVEAPTTSKVSFISTDNIMKANKYTYHTVGDRINLQLINTNYSYIDFNTSLCFINGTDIKSMQQKDLNWNCKCLPKWHGSDCSQPEVVWRAFLAYRKPIVNGSPRKYQRRIIYIFEVDKFSEFITEMRINEMQNVVDLFVFSENDSVGIIEKKLRNNFLKQHHHKIFYIKGVAIKNIIWTLKTNIKDLQGDDIIMYNENNIIPNNLALVYFKYHNNWPEPLTFRLRWSVYGFFWIHPRRTIVQGFASTVAYLYKTFSNDLNFLINSSVSNKSFTLGDLNHYGGWFCEFCYEASAIIDYLKTNKNQIVWSTVGKQTIDNNYVEDLIENGLYIDGKTELVRGHRFSESYFAPQFVNKNSWKFDFLLVNMYSKMDYYQ